MKNVSFVLRINIDGVFTIITILWRDTFNSHITLVRIVSVNRLLSLPLKLKESFSYIIRVYMEFTMKYRLVDLSRILKKIRMIMKERISMDSFCKRERKDKIWLARKSRLRGIRPILI